MRVLEIKKKDKYSVKSIEFCFDLLQITNGLYNSVVVSLTDDSTGEVVELKAHEALNYKAHGIWLSGNICYFGVVSKEEAKLMDLIQLVEHNAINCNDIGGYGLWNEFCGNIISFLKLDLKLYSHIRLEDDILIHECKTGVFKYKILDLTKFKSILAKDIMLNKSTSGFVIGEVDSVDYVHHMMSSFPTVTAHPDPSSSLKAISRISHHYNHGGVK